MDLYNGIVQDHCASSAMDFHQVHCWKPSRRTFRRTASWAQHQDTTTVRTYGALSSEVCKRALVVRLYVSL